MTLPSHICIRRSARARRMALRLDTKERVFHLVVPKGVSLRKAEAFAEGHQDWMEEKLQELPPQILLEDGCLIPIFGERTRIRIHYTPDLERTKLLLESRVLHVFTNKEDPSPRIVRFLKALAKQELEVLTREKAEIIRKKVRAISVRDTKSRWGSCSSDGKLSFSWRLIFAPPEALDYVVAHEVAHLKHLDHSQRFWDVCEALSNDYEEGKYWMRNHGHELMRYGVPSSNSQLRSAA